MKKSISLILVLAAIVGCLSFVSYRSKSFASDLKVAILTADVFDDNYTGQTIKDASQQLKSQGITADLIECKGENFRQRLTEAASSHEMVVCVGKQFWEIGEVSGDYPSVQFVWMDNTVEVPEDYPNLENVTFNENQGAYLAGYVAAAMTESGVIGIIAPDKSSSFVRYAAGFIQGAKSANSSVDVVSALAGTGNRDSAYKAAMALIEKDADVLLEIGYGNNTGIYEAAKDNDVYVIGTEVDRKLSLPQYDDLILCSVKKDIGRAIVRVVTRYDDYGQMSGGMNISVGVNEGYVDICFGNDFSTQLVDENLVTQVKYLRDGIINNVTTVVTDSNIFDQAIQITGPVANEDTSQTSDGSSETNTGTGNGEPDVRIVPDK